jgi:hypothetical protein
MSSEQSTRYALIFIGLLLALVVALGWAAGSVWVGLLCLAGLVVLFLAVDKGTNSKYGAFLFYSLIGLALLGAATWLADLAGRWLWTPLWLLAAVLIGATGSVIRDKGGRGVGNLALFIATLCGLFALAGPLWLAGPGRLSGLVNQSGEWLSFGISQPEARLAAVKTFLTSAVGSGWGLFYLLLLFILGQLWLRRWGGALVLLALLAGVWFGADPNGAPPAGLLHFFSDGPVARLLEGLLAATQRFGSPGWGVLAGGLIVTVLTFPALRESLRANRAAAQVAGLKQVLGTTMAMGHLQRQGFSTGRYIVATLILVLVNLGLPVALWVALRRLAEMETSPSFLILADITVPHWQPVWQSPYYLLALLLGLANILQNRQQRKYLQVRLPPLFQHPASLLLGALLIGSFIPAGVLLFLLGATVGRSLTAPLAFWGQVERRRPAQPTPPPVVEREIRCPTPAPTPQIPAAQPIQRPVPTVPAVQATPEPKPEPAPQPAMAGDLLFTHPAAIVDLVTAARDTYYVLDTRGRLARWRQGKLEVMTPLKVARPLGLIESPAKEQAAQPLTPTQPPGQKVMVIDGAGKILAVSYREDSLPGIQEQAISTPVDCFALNPYGTILAFAAAGGEQISGLFLAPGKEQVLANNLGGVSALAFSADGRYLALGDAAGCVHLLDMSSRRLTQTLGPPATETGRVVALVAGPRGVWLAGYGNHDLASWDAQGRLRHQVKLRSAIAGLAVDPDSGQVAVGSQRGYIRVRSPDLGQVIFDQQAHSDRVIRLVFEEQGHVLVSAGQDGSVRRISL